MHISDVEHVKKMFDKYDTDASLSIEKEEFIELTRSQVLAVGFRAKAVDASRRAVTTASANGNSLEAVDEQQQQPVLDTAEQPLADAKVSSSMASGTADEAKVPASRREAEQRSHCCLRRSPGSPAGRTLALTAPPTPASQQTAADHLCSRGD